MKSLKKLLIITFCSALVLSTITIPSDYEINPCGHYDNKGENF